MGGKIIFAGDPLRRIQNGLIQEIHIRPVGPQQGFHFFSQFGILAASLIEEGRPGVGLQI
ncbi:MAG: hypothetical protein ABSF64_35735 [Bryobacteraceae bacterium]